MISETNNILSSVKIEKKTQFKISKLIEFNTIVNGCELKLNMLFSNFTFNTLNTDELGKKNIERVSVRWIILKKFQLEGSWGSSLSPPPFHDPKLIN